MKRLAAQALEQLFHARRILGYSYVFAFYMFGNDVFREEVTRAQNALNQNLFEDQQQQLEGEARPCLGAPGFFPQTQVPVPWFTRLENAWAFRGRRAPLPHEWRCVTLSQS